MKKQHRVSFSCRSKKKLELVHSDVYGPMDMETLRGSKYFSPLLMILLGRYGFICLD